MLRLILTLLISIIFFSGCFEYATISAYAPPKKVDLKDEDVKITHKQEYDKLIQERDSTRKYIDDLEAQKMDAHNEIMNVLKGSALYDNNMEAGDGRAPIGGSMSNYHSPEAAIKHNQQTYDITCNEIVKQRKKLNKIYDKLAELEEENKKSCFPKDIKILTSSKELKNISDVKVGDEVLVYDIAKDRLISSKVKNKYIDTNNHYYKINENVEATAFERFLTQDGWKITRELNKGDKIFNGNSYIKIETISKVNKNLKVYNLHIDSSHNFFVSKDGKDFYLVHNTSGGGSSGSGGGK